MVIGMVINFSKVGAIMIILAFVLGAFLIPAGANDSRAVEYTVEKTDTSGDPEGLPGFSDNAVQNDADILKITSAKSGDNIVLTMQVGGTIHVKGTTFYTGYQFNIDIDGDAIYDWLATTSSNLNYEGTNAQLQDDYDKLYYLDNSTGDGTDTVTLQFPLTHITSMETIESWNIYGTASVAKLSTGASYVDVAPDGGFVDDGGGDGGGGDGGGGDGGGGDGGGGDDKGIDPATETPTDTSIQVGITKADYSMKEKEDTYEISILVQGTTSGVDHCEFVEVDYYADGSHDEVYWEEAFDTSFGGLTSHFKATSDNWKTWEYKVEGSISKSLWDSDDSSGEEPTKAVIYIRAFSDAGETKWNQASKDITSQVKGGGDGTDDKKDDDNDSPGFEAIFTIIALGAVVIISRVYYRRKQR